MNIQYLTSQIQRRNCTQLHKTAAEQRNKHLEWKWDIVPPLPVGSRHHTEIAAEPVGVVPWQLGLRLDVTTTHHSNRPRLPVTAWGQCCHGDTPTEQWAFAFFLAECVCVRKGGCKQTMLKKMHCRSQHISPINIQLICAGVSLFLPSGVNHSLNILMNKQNAGINI